MTLLINSIISALVNVIILAGIPFGIYFAVQKRWKERGAREIFQRVGLQVGPPRYLLYSVGFVTVFLALFVALPPDVEPFTREGSANKSFVGLGLNGSAVFLALLYGFVKTGFPEELLFRGMIAGSLSRRLPFWAANLIQAVIFLLPHLVLLNVMPELWVVLVGVFAGALFAGWLRIKSESILGPTLIHASINVAMCLHVAIATANGSTN